MKKILNILALFASVVSTVVSLRSGGSADILNSPRTYLKHHNSIREYVLSRPLRWDPRIARYAFIFLNRHIKDCLGSKPSITSGIGWNIARRWGNFTYSGLQAILDWELQQDNYDYVTNSCVHGECRAYTQIVWNQSTHLGCARVKCHNHIGDVGYLFRCNYQPPGNIPGQRPY